MPEFNTNYTPRPETINGGYIVALSEEHKALLEAAASDAALDDVLARYVAALKELASTPADTLEQIRDKGRALATCVETSHHHPAVINGDYGLGASLIEDLARFEGVIILGRKFNIINNAETALLSA